MSKILSFRGRLLDGVQQKIKLSTLNGKTGYKIKKFQTIQTTPGVADVELITKVYSKDQTGSLSTTVDFTEGDLLAIAVYNANSAAFNYPITNTVVFDNEVFNQDIYIYGGDTSGTADTNYYLELETVTLSDVQSTQLTLKNLRNLASR
jgi:hypothetical protein|tara:strand:- start:98 stop:544 length:447 start_codon:yes stop_codon:yes gene_type:complete